MLTGTSRTAYVAAAAALLAGARPTLAQTRVVAGVVLTERSLRPVAGAQVVADDTSSRAVSDASGRFRLVVGFGVGVPLTVRRIGFRALRRLVRADETELRIVLTETAVELGDVVVTGTAEATERRALGNAVASIGAAEVVERGAVSSFSQLVNGRAPGVVIEPGSGMVGAGARITIRGGTSLALGNAPLLYVDGVRVNNAPVTGPVSQFSSAGPISRVDDLDPDDVERIEIIKGPAAATLYGTEASAGVMNVITKRGTPGPARWTLGARVGAHYLRDPEGRFPTNYERDAAGTVTSLDIVERESASGRPIFRSGRSQQYQLSVSGGAAQLRYYLSGGYDASDGVERFNELRRHSARLNVSLVPSDKITVDASLGHTGGPTRLSPEGGLAGRVGSTFNADPRNAPGGGGDTTRRGFARGLPEEYDLLAAHGAKFEQALDHLTTSLRVEHRPLRWLGQRLRLGYDRSDATNTTFLPRVDALVATSPFSDRALGYKEVSVGLTEFETVDYAVTASADATPTLRLGTSLGGQYYRTGTSRVLSSGSDFPVEGLSTISSTTGARSTEEDSFEDVTLGIYVQELVAWRDRLFVTAALRADDNSAFGANFDRVYYPKAALSWVVSAEPFFPARWMKTLRLRAAYGEAGEQPPTFDALRAYRPVTGAHDEPAVTPQSIGNPDLGPERGKELELGVDAGLLDDRLSLELTYYHKRTVDAILPRELAPSGGYPGVQLFNAAEIRNSGVELLARVVPVRQERWAWDVSLTLMSNHNEVASLGDAAPAFVAAGEYLGHRVGHPVGSWFEKRVVSADMDPTGKVSNVRCDDGHRGTTPCAGADGAYGTSDDAPAVYLGRTIPTVQGGLASTVSLLRRRLSVNALIDFKTGHHKLDLNDFGRCTNQGRCRESFYPTEFDPRRIAAIRAGGNLVDHVIVDASLAKLRELSVAYTLPDRWAGAVGASRASVALAGRELHTWTRYTGLEPEAMYLGGPRGGNYGSYEQFMVPQLSRWVVAVNVGY